MAVGRLSGAWIRQVLTDVYPGGVVRRSLLDHFASLLVSKKSSKGAKGRLARRLYGRLLKLQRRGLITQEEGIVRILAAPTKAKGEVSPALDAPLERLLFKALLAEDGQGDGHTPTALQAARWEFLSRAIESGWSVEEAASILGVKAAQAAQVLKEK
jgi:hypothetical protein